MLVLHDPKTISTHWKDTDLFPNSSTCSISHATLTVCSLPSHNSIKRQNKCLLHSVSYSWGSSKSFSGNHLWISLRQGAPKKSLHIHASSDEDYRSSRNIATSLYRRYRNFIDRGGIDNLTEFISAGVNAYALGCTDEGIRIELLNMKDSGVEIDGLQTYGRRTGVKYKIYSEEVRECILWLSIIFITILCTPQPTVIRWSPTPPVSEEMMLQWKGFCTLIANAYYIKGMAWLPVKTLQLEQMAVMGRAEDPSLVSSRMQLVFSTLEVVSPQWPKV